MYDAKAKVARELALATSDLTTAEAMRVALEVFGDFMSRIVRDEIRQERHGNRDTPGGLEGG